MAHYQIKNAEGHKINVVLWDGESAFPLPESHTIEPDDGSPLYDAPAEPTIPEQETLSDWRVGLIKAGRFQDVKARVEAARDSGTEAGLIAWDRLEYANHVYRAELQTFKDLFGFTAEEVDQSMMWAAQVRTASPA